MSLWEYIDWDMTEKNAEKILRDFSDIEGLKEVLDGVQSLMDSDVYDKVYEASENDPEEMTYYTESVDELLKLRHVELASEILKDPPLYTASLMGIISSHFQATFAFIGGIHYAHAQRRLSTHLL